MVIQRYDVPPPEDKYVFFSEKLLSEPNMNWFRSPANMEKWEKMVKTLVCSRVFNLLRNWVTHYWYNLRCPLLLVSF